MGRRIKVYCTRNNEIKKIFLCRGVLIDELLSCKTKFSRSNVMAGYLLVDDNEKVYHGMLCYFACVRKQGKTRDCFITTRTDLYTDKFSAAASAKKLGGELASINTVELDCRVIPKYAPNQEFKTYIHRDENGKYYARMQVHPEEQGSSMQGPFFFPSKDFSPVYEGEAIVSVESEDKTYGYINGRMVRYSHISDTELLTLINQGNLLTYEDSIANVSSAVHGQYSVRIRGEELCIIASDNGNIKVIPAPGYVSEDLREETTDTRKVFQIWQSSLGVVYSLEDVDPRVFKFYIWNRSEKYYSDLVDKAISIGFMQGLQYSNGSIEILLLAGDAYKKVTAFTQEEVTELVDTLNKTNQKALLSLNSLAPKI